VQAALVTLATGEVHLRGQPSPHGYLSVDAVEAQEAALTSLIAKVAREPDSEGLNGILTDFKEAAFMNTGETALIFVTWLVCYFLLAAYYHKYVLFYAPVEEEKSKLAKQQTFQGFHYFRSGLFDCASEPGICFWSCCCPGIRWADTMSNLGVHSFYTSFWILTALYCIMFWPLATMIGHLVIAAVMAWQRQAIREQFEFEDQGGITCASDCFTYIFCMCCAVAQEARQCREACKVGHPAITPMSPRSND
jgi:Cys-rich protein (TIGR01571 family)